ncbi:hypothetical protein X566_20460 [Afipia sp. P52-10]|uniref:PAS domain-containing protein n=1 Tax=Afipia sp. P52-10 TaxID=1429916 RepID=UPI0003DF27BB|nr:PAS domain-containing protein [Afipia sp. P52-10]ETR75928.1 hypothetical protein X566_20460 [Afipia sp. P52-10]
MTKKKNNTEYTEYIAAMAHQLADLAKEINRPFLSTVLRMAFLEALEMPSAPRDNHPAMSPPSEAGDLLYRTIGFFDWDIPNDRVYADAAFARAFGVNPSNAHDGTPLEHYIRGVHRDDRKRLEQAITVAIEQHTLLSIEYRLVDDAGGVQRVRATGQVIYDRDGQPIRFPGTVVAIDNPLLRRAAA